MVLLNKLIEQISYKKRIWLTGFLKTTIASGLIATGIVSIFAGIVEHPLLKKWNETEIIIGVIAIIIGVVIVIIIDRYSEAKKKEELEIIDQTIEDKAEEIAENLIIEKLKEIEKNSK